MGQQVVIGLTVIGPADIDAKLLHAELHVLPKLSYTWITFERAIPRTRHSSR